MRDDLFLERDIAIRKDTDLTSPAAKFTLWTAAPFVMGGAIFEEYSLLIQHARGRACFLKRADTGVSALSSALVSDPLG